MLLPALLLNVFEHSVYDLGFYFFTILFGFLKELVPSLGSLGILTCVIFLCYGYKVLLLRRAIHRCGLCGETAASFRVSQQVCNGSWENNIFKMRASDRLFF